MGTLNLSDLEYRQEFEALYKNLEFHLEVHEGALRYSRFATRDSYKHFLTLRKAHGNCRAAVERFFEADVSTSDATFQTTTFVNGWQAGYSQALLDNQLISEPLKYD